MREVDVADKVFLHSANQFSVFVLSRYAFSAASVCWLCVGWAPNSINGDRVEQIMQKTKK